MDAGSGMKAEVSKSLIDKIYSSFSDGLRFAVPISSARTNEFELVRGVLQILQGLSSSLIYWDQTGQSYRVKSGIYLSHLSQTSLFVILDQFVYAATCLQMVEVVLHKVETSRRAPPPTLRAFACSVSAWLRRLRDVALKEEVKVSNSDGGTAPTLLGLANSLSSLCAEAEYLLQIVRGAIPQMYFEPDLPVSATDISAHILNYLYKKLNEVCHVQGGEEDAYRMLLYMFVGSILPYIEGLDAWIFEGTLDDPFEEMFFYANREISIDKSDFWEKSYHLRQTQHEKLDIDHATDLLPLTIRNLAGRESNSVSTSVKTKEQSERDLHVCPLFFRDIAKEIISAGKSLQLIQHAPAGFSAVSCHYKNERSIAQLSLSEVFCLSLVALIGHGDHLSEFFWKDDGIISAFKALAGKKTLEGDDYSNPGGACSEKIWYKILVDSLPSKGDTESIVSSFCPENPTITLCQRVLNANSGAWDTLNISRSFSLPPLNDEDLKGAIFGGTSGAYTAANGSNYTSRFPFGESECFRSWEDSKVLEALFPFPTILPSFKEELLVSELLPFQKNSTLSSRVLNWIQVVEPKSTPLPVVILQECLIYYIKKQVDQIGSQILSKLLCEWRLMDELGVLRAIYLLGSGDLLQHFFTIIFDKLDKGESWDDDFELNTVLQESIRNSADGIILSSPDSLVVSITKNQGSGGDEQHNSSFLVSTPRKSRAHTFGINGLDLLKFTYKISWPLELIANAEALKKYNQVMNFLLKVKRAKFVLDKARRCMWKDRRTVTINRKRSWLVEQKLLHFVDAFHQYVMDRVYHSAWHELCEGMAAAGSLDQVLEVHETYLLSIQRQCFVVPDKLWAILASRINTILGLALDFYTIQQTLSSGGAVSAMKARFEMEVDRIERQFDDCIAFLLRILSFKLNVGQFPHLADLVTRINYNYFYMSDSGNLITAPSSDMVSVKLGKTVPVRTD